MRGVQLLVLCFIIVQILPSTDAYRPAKLPEIMAEIAWRGSNGMLENTCKAGKRPAIVSVQSIQLPSGKRFSIYQPSKKQRTLKPRFYTLFNITRFDDCAAEADRKDALMFEIHNGSKCRLAFFQWRRYKQRLFCRRDHYFHVYMLEGATKKGAIHDGVCTLHDFSLLKRYHQIQYQSLCNKLRYDCQSKTGEPKIVGAVFETTPFGCMYRHHRETSNFFQGRTFCRKLHSRLFVPTDAKQRDHFLQYHKKVGAQTTYIGLRRRYRSGKWKWLHSSLYNNGTSKEGWKPGFPCARNHSSCAIIEQNVGAMKNAPCDKKFRNICFRNRKDGQH